MSMVEVAFTVSPKVRRIAAHDPNTLPLWDYYKQVFWSSGIDLDKDSFASLTEEVTLDALELPAGEKAVLSMQLPSHFIIVFEPVTHSAHFIDVQGEPTKERQQHRTDLQQSASADRVDHLCVRVRCGSRSTISPTCGRCPPSLSRPTCSTIFWASAGHSSLPSGCCRTRRSAMCSRPTISTSISVSKSLLVLFTDLKGSTALYERVGDLVAFDLVRAHFHALLEIIAAEKGAVVKTIGDAVMATFLPAGPCARRGLADAGGDGKAQCRARQVRPDPKDRHP